jgi:flagellar biosynthesis anti-sigma factor FlgM
MRIDLSTLFAGQVSAEKTAGKPSSVVVPGKDHAPEDKATLSADAAAVQSLQSQVLQMPAVRQDVVDGLRDEVRQGNYKVDSNKVADALIAAHKT